MKSIVFDNEFVAAGCKNGKGLEGSPSEVVTVGAGSRWGEVYEATNARGKLVVGGFAATVGASGGYVLGGGHSALSPQLGLAVDNVLQFTVVTPTGNLITASSCQNSDIFWALRGGGGGFGVVLSTTHKLHNDREATLVNVTAIATTPEAHKEYINRWIALMPNLQNHKASGYFYQVDTLLIVPMLLIPTQNTTLVTTLLQSVLAGSVPGVIVQFNILVSSPSTLPLYYQLATSIDGPEGGGSVLLSSRLMPTKLFKTKPTKITETFLSLAPSSSLGTTVIWHLVAPPPTLPAYTSSTPSVNTIWRKTLLHVVLSQSFPASVSDEQYNLVKQSVANATEALKRLAPDGGAYINESDAFEKGWIESKYGSSYRRLKEIKRRVDPEEVFICRQCVGWEGWDDEGVCRV
ncbi:hypothetical protein HK097_010820 [Rhizophlyctis rosea]|uniref:FAD-binding PCMH-type domain-containing protein n=1 Tax=Rhizophlyctis rosea TaxID=64517 RepID=A0AAD5S9E5_9FUNG|nr:hypothetical protein HK097_010820 [Rhizophlyctis rosea]